MSVPCLRNTLKSKYRYTNQDVYPRPTSSSSFGTCSHTSTRRVSASRLLEKVFQLAIREKASPVGQSSLLTLWWKKTIAERQLLHRTQQQRSCSLLDPTAAHSINQLSIMVCMSWKSGRSLARVPCPADPLRAARRPDPHRCFARHEFEDFLRLWSPAQKALYS